MKIETVWVNFGMVHKKTNELITFSSGENNEMICKWYYITAFFLLLFRL